MAQTRSWLQCLTAWAMLGHRARIGDLTDYLQMGAGPVHDRRGCRADQGEGAVGHPGRTSGKG